MQNRKQSERLNDIFSRVDLIRQQGQNDFRLNRFQNAVERLQINTKAHGRRSLIFNPTQEMVFHEILASWEQRKPVRIICCKARQMGISTLISGVMMSLAYLVRGRRGKVVAHRDTAAQHIMGMHRYFWRYMPRDMKEQKPMYAISTKRLVYCSPHDSIITCATANNPALASGETLDDTHMSEVAKYTDPPARDAIISIHQCVPDNWFTMVFWEGTAYGEHNLFHDYWVAAEKGENGFKNIFASWKSFPEYFLPGPKPVLDRIESEYQRRYNVCDSQMRWLVATKAGKCNGSWDEFNQEYPIVAELAFKSTGRGWFDKLGLEKCSVRVGEPLCYADLRFVSESHPAVEFVEAEYGPLSVWEHPIPNTQYVIGADVGEGVGGDYSVGIVLQAGEQPTDAPRQVAEFRSNKISAELFGVELFKLGMYYNQALAACEVNNQGLVTNRVLENGTVDYPQTHSGYPNPFRFLTVDRVVERSSLKIGWPTNAQTKQVMLGVLKELIDSGGIEIRSRASRVEVGSFSWDPMRKKWFSTNSDPYTKTAHDDCVIAISIGVQALIRLYTDRSLVRGGSGGW